MSVPLSPFTGHYLEIEGTVPSAETLIGTAKTIRIVELILTNITASDVTVTIKNNEATPLTEAAFVVSANDQITPSYEGGWKLTSGIRLSDGSGASIRYQIKGYKEY